MSEARATFSVPDTLVGLAVIWTEDDGSVSARWQDRLNGVAAERRRVAAALRVLAGALDRRAEEVGG